MNDLPPVSAVHGSWSTKDFRRVLVLRWQEKSSTETQVESLSEGAIAAYEAWNEQATVPTPIQRAEEIVDILARRGVHRGSLEGAEAQDVIEATIERALAADRQERADVATTVNQNAVAAPTPAQTARAIVADWAAAHRTHYADDNGFGTAPDTGRASLDDLEWRIATALGTTEG